MGSTRVAKVFEIDDAVEADEYEELLEAWETGDDKVGGMMPQGGGLLLVRPQVWESGTSWFPFFEDEELGTLADLVHQEIAVREGETRAKLVRLLSKIEGTIEGTS